MEESDYPEVMAPWVRCPHCDDFYCNAHGEHVYDCPCPVIDQWASRRLDPYGNMQRDVLFSFLRRHRSGH